MGGRDEDDVTAAGGEDGGNGAGGLIVSTDGPHQIALKASTKRLSIAAKGAWAGLGAAVLGLGYLLQWGNPAKVLALCVFLGMLVGACFVMLVTHSRFEDFRFFLAKTNEEIERKAAENTKLRNLVLKQARSSDPNKSSDGEPPADKPAKRTNPRGRKGRA